MANRLAQTNSPYLIQHADNPVDWYPWANEALEKARQEDKPIFLSIGYAACHWCHVMAHESFEDSSTAAIMNENFVNIKVDREERPDLDSIYMNAVVAMTGQGGWPMSVFLTPDGEPFYGGTYFPPVRRYNMPSFSEVLLSVARLWSDDRTKLLQSGRKITDHLKETYSLDVSGEQVLKIETLDQAVMRLAQSYDWTNGGWGKAPKFPQPMALEFLLRRSAKGDKLALDIAKHALDAMAKGGMYDVIGGGFARYSTDNQWLIPHFEKMLYDNAQLAQIYLHAYLITGDSSYRRICEETLDFIIREMMDHSNSERAGFYSSIDADSEGEEGIYYLWTADELRDVLASGRTAEEDASLKVLDWADIFFSAYGIHARGNFEGRTVLQRVQTDQQLAERFSLSQEQLSRLFVRMHACLLNSRESRVRPGIDDKVLVSWNALALVVYAEAARYLSRRDYLEIARKNADFLLTELYIGDRLFRAWRNGLAQHSAYLEDYAGLILGLLSLYQSDPDLWWFNSAMELADDMIKHFRDPKGGFFDVRDDHDPILVRPRDLQDNATPSGSALAVFALAQLFVYTGNDLLRDQYEDFVLGVLGIVSLSPLFYSKWLCAINFILIPTSAVVIVGDPVDLRTRMLIKTLWSKYRPHCIAAISAYPPPSNAPPILHNRSLINGQATAYVCQNFVCQQPVNTVEEFSIQIHSQ